MAGNSDWNPTGDWSNEPPADQPEEQRQESAPKPRGSGRGGHKGEHYCRTVPASDIKEDWTRSTLPDTGKKLSRSSCNADPAQRKPDTYEITTFSARDSDLYKARGREAAIGLENLTILEVACDREWRQAQESLEQARMKAVKVVETAFAESTLKIQEQYQETKKRMKQARDNLERYRISKDTQLSHYEKVLLQEKATELRFLRVAVADPSGALRNAVFDSCKSQGVDQNLLHSLDRDVNTDRKTDAGVSRSEQYDTGLLASDVRYQPVWNPTGDWANEPPADQPEEQKQESASKPRGSGRGGPKGGHYVRPVPASDVKEDWTQSTFVPKEGKEETKEGGVLSSKKFRNVHSEETQDFRPRGNRGRRPRGGRGRGGRRGGTGGPRTTESPAATAPGDAAPRYHGDIENKTKETVTIKRRGRRFITNEHPTEEFHSEDIPMDPSLLTTDSHFKADVAWEELNLPTELVALLHTSGYPYPSKVQAHGIKLLLENHEDSIIIQAPTGSGKTVTFILGTLTAIDRANPNIQVLLVAPTNELLDQLTTEYQAFAEPLGIKVVHYRRGDKTIDGQVALMTPAQCTGIFKMYGEHKPNTDSVKFLILDEADHLLNAEDQPEFFNHMETVIKEYLPPTCRCLLFSATFSDPVMEKIESVLEKGFVEVTVKKEELVLENIKMYYIRKVEDQNKIDLLIKVLRESVPGVTIVFSNTVRFAQTLYRVLNERGTKTALLVGKNMTADERTKTMADFMQGFYSVLVTTNVLARGIDNTRVSRVINFDLPKHHTSGKVDAETYLHRIGRSGRFNRPGIAISVVTNDDELQMLDDIKNYYGSTCTIERLERDEDLQEKMHLFAEELGKLGEAE